MNKFVLFFFVVTLAMALLALDSFGSLVRAQEQIDAAVGVAGTVANDGALPGGALPGAARPCSVPAIRSPSCAFRVGRRPRPDCGK